jgi:hypothetical protein
MHELCIGLCVAAQIAPFPIVGGAGIVHAVLQQSGGAESALVETAWCVAGLLFAAL